MNRDYYVKDYPSVATLFWARDVKQVNGMYYVGFVSNIGLALEVQCTNITRSLSEIYIDKAGDMYGIQSPQHIELFSIRPKIYSLYGTDDSITTINMSVWTSTFVTSSVLPGKWVRNTDNNTIGWYYRSYSNLYALTWNGSTRNLTKIIFLEEGLCIFKDYMTYQDNDNFRLHYPIYKKQGSYYETAIDIPSTSEILTFISFLGECYTSTLDLNIGHMNYETMAEREDIESGNYNYYSITAPNGFPKEGFSDTRYNIPRYSVKNKGIGILPFTNTSSNIKFQEKNSNLPLYAGKSRSNPWVLIATSNSLTNYWIDPYTLCINNILYRIPQQWEVHKCERQGIRLDSNNLTITNPIHDGYYDISVIIAGTSTESTGGLVASTFRSGQTSRIDIEGNFNDCGGQIKEYILNRNNTEIRQSSQTYDTKTVTINNNITLNMDIKAGYTGGWASGQFIVLSESRLKSNNSAFTLYIKYKITNVPIIPGCNFTSTTTNTSNSGTINQSFQGSVLSWPEREIFNDDYWRIESYNDWFRTGGTYQTYNSRTFIGLYTKIKAGQDGIIGAGTRKLTTPNATAFSFPYRPSTSSTTTFNNIICDYGISSGSTTTGYYAHYVGVKTEVSSKESNPGNAYKVIIAYPNN